jgi:hypothetical protein
MEWDQDARQLLEQLMKPIPIFIRPIARKGIEKKIVEQAQERVTRDAVIRGYILSSSGKMKARALKTLEANQIDLKAYEALWKP